MTTRLSEMIASLHEMCNVNLMNKDIDAEGTSALAEAFKVNTTVTTINLRYGRIGAEGVAALADALKVNTTGDTHISQ
jgi:hypothetical protein